MLVLGVAAVVVTGDQLAKTWAEDHLAQRSIHVLGPVWFRLVFNTGAAFSIGRGLAPALAILAVLAVGGILFAARSFSSSPWAVVAGGLVAGGAMGNLADRVLRHNHRAVIDFIWTSFWPTFNVADSAITVGIVILVVVMLRGHRNTSSTSEEASSPGGSVADGGSSAPGA